MYMAICDVGYIDLGSDQNGKNTWEYTKKPGKINSGIPKREMEMGTI